jgi:outer membrane protein assembly factor BamB
VAFLRGKRTADGTPRATRPSRALKKNVKSRMPSIIAGVTVPAVLATLAIANPGVTISEVELNDGTVWVTNTTDLKIGRYNAKVKELNGGVVAASTAFDVLQYETDVVAVEPATVSKIDPATMSNSAVAQVPSQSHVAMNGGIVSIADPTGRIWIAPVSALETITDATPVSLDLSDGAVTTVDGNGNVYAFDPGTGTVHVLEVTNGAAVESQSVTLKDASGIPISANPAEAPTITNQTLSHCSPTETSQSSKQTAQPAVKFS